MKNSALTILCFAGALCTVKANPVVYLPFGTNAGGALDGTWNAYQQDGVSRTFDGSRNFAGLQTFQPTYGTAVLPPGQLFGPNTTGNLVAITSAAENAAMTQISNGTRHIGLTDSTSVSTIDSYNYAALGTFETGGGGAALASGGGDPGFRWVTGESTAYKAWNSGEPNDFNAVEDSADLNDAGIWNDITSGSTLAGQLDDNQKGGIIEYRVNVPASIITTIDAWKGTMYKSGSTQITNLAAADALIGGSDLTGSATAYYTHMNVTENGGEGFFSGDVGVFGTNGGDSDDYAFQGIGKLVIDSTGSYQFRTTSDDGARLRIDLNFDADFLDPGELVISDDALQGQSNQVNSLLLTLDPGLYNIEYTWFERGGGAGGELSASKDGGAFIILGNDEGGGLNVVQIPEPATALLGAAGLLAFIRRRRA